MTADPDSRTDFTNAFDWYAFRKREAERLVWKKKSGKSFDWLDEKGWESLIEEGHINPESGEVIYGN